MNFRRIFAYVIITLLVVLGVMVLQSPYSFLHNHPGVFIVHAQTGNQVIPGVGAGTGLSGLVATVACGTNSNCVNWVEDDATNNCGAGTTAWIAAINAYSGTGVASVQINSGGGKAFKFSSCNFVFTNSHGATIQGPATIDLAMATQSGIQLGATATSNMASMAVAVPPVWRVSNLSFTGGTSLTGTGGNGSAQGGGIYTMPQDAVVYISDVNFGPSGSNAGFGANATNGTCTNYAIFFDAGFPSGFVDRVNIQSNSSGTTAGGCGIGNPFGASLGSNTIMIDNTSIYTDGEAGGTGQCGSIAINDGGTLGTQSNNNIYGYGIPVLLQGIGHKTIGNQLDSTQCAAGGVSAVIQIGGSGAVGPVSVTSNVFQTGTGHAANFIAGTSSFTGSLQGWVITSNIQNNTLSNPNIFATALNCTPLGTKGCQVSGNQNMISPTPCGGNSTGWVTGEITGSCFPLSLTANEGAQTIFTPTTTPGTFQVNCQVILTVAAATSSTLPQCTVSYTDAFTNVAVTQLVTPVWAANTPGCTGTTTNTAGNSCQGTVVIAPKAAVAVTFASINYASVSANTMTYDMNVVALALQQ